MSHSKNYHLPAIEHRYLHVNPLRPSSTDISHVTANQALRQQSDSHDSAHKNSTHQRGRQINKTSNSNRSTSRDSERSIRSSFSDFIGIPGGGRDPDGFVHRSKDEDCIKCMLRVPHDICESHRYIRVGGGYRHSFWYIKMILDELELVRQQELIRKKRLEAIPEGNLRAVKTYIRTKSGKLIEKIVFMTEDDYEDFQNFIKLGGDPSSIVRKYLNKEEGQNLESFEKEEQKPFKTTIRTKSGRIIERIVYVSKEEYDKIQRGELDANQVLRKKMNLKEGESLEGWSAAKMRTITTKIRTKSGRIIEKKIMISEEDYQKLKAGKGDIAASILSKYISESDGKIERWEKQQKAGMKVVKTFIRTKSGKLIEKTVMMTEEEFKEFQASGGDPNILRRYIKLNEGETIDKWEKSSTVYEASDDEIPSNVKPGQRVTDKQGNVYEYVTDPLTGKIYKKKVIDSKQPVYKSKDGKIITEKDIQRREALKQGKRNDDSDSEFSYKSEVSAGGTRHVKRMKKNVDGTYGEAESYHSSQDEDGEARRRRRRRDRKHEGSAHSYYSVESAGGTKHQRRRKKNADGTYGEDESYHSASSEEFNKAKKVIKQAKKKQKEKAHGSDSEHSYYSEHSEGGTRTRKRRTKIRDEHGNVIGYGKAEEYESPSDDESGTDDKKGGKNNRKVKKGKTNEVGGSDSEHSYYSEVSEGGTRHVMMKERIRDKDGRIIGHRAAKEYKGSLPIKNKKSKKKKNGSDSEYSYYSDVSAGGTKRTKRRKIIKDEHGIVIGHGEEELYDSDGAKTYITVSDGKGGKIRKLNPAKAANREKIKAAALNKEKRGKGKGKGGKGEDESDVFSNATTDSDIVRTKMANMTEEEKKQFLKEREERKKEREDKRKEKYGSEYEAMVEKHKKQKEAKKEKEKIEKEKKGAKPQSMVTYDKGGPRFKDSGKDDRGLGLGHDDWGKPKKSRRGKDGNEADSETDDEGDVTTGRRKKGKGGRSATSSASSLEEIRDEKGRLIKKIKKDKDGNVVEIEYDSDGKEIGRKIKPKKIDEEEDKGDYFEVGEDGKIRLKKGKKKLDIDKMSRDDLRALGIDPNLSKAEIMKQLKEKFGDQIDIVYKGGKIGTKRIEDYSDANSDILADDSDIDVETLKGIQRMRVILKKGGDKLMNHMHKLIEQSLLSEFVTEEEKNSEIDFLAAYRLVDPEKLEQYGKVFVVEDYDDMDGVINMRCAKRAAKMLQNISHITEKQMDYALQVLCIDDNTQVSFRMFAVLSSLCERITKMDQFCRDLLEITNLIDIERKLDLYRKMFYCNVQSERDPNYIKIESLRIELMAGGLSYKQQEFIMEKLQPNEYFEISFLDYLCYIPLFLSFHDNILNNPLDMSELKYTPKYRRKASAQRDMNPLGYHLKKDTKFLKDKAQDLLAGKPIDQNIKKETEKMLKRFDMDEPLDVPHKGRNSKTPQSRAS